MKQDGLAVGINPDAKEASHTQDQKFNLPADMADGGPQGLFQIDQDQHRAEEGKNVIEISRPSQPQNPCLLTT